MENQMNLLFDKIKDQLSLQTAEITESVTKSVLQSIDKKLASIIEENKFLKTKVEALQQKIDTLEDNRRKHNLIFFGVKETEQEGSLIDYTKSIIEKETKTTIHPYEINIVRRLGAKGNDTRPLLVGFTSIWKRNLILKNRNKNRNQTSTVTIKEDFSKDVLLKRKELIPKLILEREKGKIAYMKKDKLIVKETKEVGLAKRKRDPNDSPNDKKSRPRPAPKKTNTNTNISDYVIRGQSSPVPSCSDSKN